MHFVGIAGTGMSALASYRAMAGLKTSGSDREFDRGHEEPLRETFEQLGITIHAQDGSAIPHCSTVVSSTAVEAAIPDLQSAKRLDRPVVHRAEMLAALLADQQGIAIAGTSGKSTTTALTFTALEAAGADPSLVTGAPLAALSARRGPGNAWRGTGPLVAEADESDGSLVRHHPAIGVLLNLHRDHMEEAKVHQLRASSLPP